jgi:hypothetical protein
MTTLTGCAAAVGVAVGIAEVPEGAEAVLDTAAVTAAEVDELDPPQAATPRAAIAGRRAMRGVRGIRRSGR